MQNMNRLVGIVFAGIAVQFFVLWAILSGFSFSVTFLHIFVLTISVLCINGIILLAVYKSHSVDTNRVKKLASKYELTIILFNLLKSLSHEEDTHKIYESILRAAAKSIPSCEYGSIILSRNGKMIYEASFGFNHEYLKIIELNLEDTALYKMTNGKMDHAIIVKDIINVNDKAENKDNIEIFKKIGIDKIKSTVSAPISVGDRVIGSINLDSIVQNCFDEEDIETLEIFALEVGKFVQLHQMNELNRQMSRYDDLTKTYNRAYCKGEIKQLIESKIPFHIVSVDLNGLKIINDAFGHDLGDVYLLNFVQITQVFIPQNVIFSRYGGDEFILIFPRTEILSIQVVMEDIAKYLKAHPVEKEGKTITISFSYGISSFPEETTSYDELLKIADAKMYEAKKHYRETCEQSIIT